MHCVCYAAADTTYCLKETEEKLARQTKALRRVMALRKVGTFIKIIKARAAARAAAKAKEAAMAAVREYEAAAKALRADSGDHTPVASRAAKNTYLKNSNKSPNDVSMTKRTLSLSRSAYPPKPCRNAMPL